MPTRLQRYKLRKQELLDPKLHRCHDNDESNYVDEYEDDDDVVITIMIMIMIMIPPLQLLIRLAGQN